MNDLQTLFKETSPTRAPAGLAERVLVAVSQAEAREIKMGRQIWGVLSLVSVAALAASSTYAVHVYAGSSFASYFSLIFSDLGSVTSWWRELGLSLLESLPILGTVLFLASMFFVLWSVRKFAKESDKHVTPFITNAIATAA